MRIWRKNAGFSGAAQVKQTFDVVGEAHQFPLRVYVREPSKKELSEADGFFDDAEYRFDRLFAHCIKSSTGVGGKLVAHFLQEWVGNGLRWILCRRPKVILSLLMGAVA